MTFDCRSGLGRNIERHAAFSLSSSLPPFFPFQTFAWRIQPRVRPSHVAIEGRGRERERGRMKYLLVDQWTELPNAAKRSHLTAHLLFSVHATLFFMCAPIREYFTDERDMI